MFSCDSYFINNEVLCVEAVFTGEYKSKITTTTGIKFSILTVRDLINKACIRFASTLEGRMQAIKKFMKYLNKTPILIEPDKIGAFPTRSYKHDECIWVFNHYFEVEELDKKKSRLTFSNGSSIIVNASKNVLLKQQQRLYTIIGMYRLP